jgi:osmotically-inducible protein OsmY
MKFAARLLVLLGLLAASSGCLRFVADEVDASDSSIRARLESQFQATKGLDLRYVTLDVHSRIVTLSGLVNSFEDKRTLVRIATKTQGVDQVVDNLVLQE